MFLPRLKVLIIVTHLTCVTCWMSTNWHMCFCLALTQRSFTAVILQASHRHPTFKHVHSHNTSPNLMRTVTSPSNMRESQCDWIAVKWQHLCFHWSGQKHGWHARTSRWTCPKVPMQKWRGLGLKIRGCCQTRKSVSSKSSECTRHVQQNR